jgi:hypothetical protein
VPWQIVVALAFIDTAGTEVAVTVIEMILLLAVVGVAQVALDVMIRSI